MSGKLMGLCYNLKIKRGQRAVLLAFADHADEETGICWPSVELMAWKTDLCKRQVQRLIRQLCDLDILRVIENAKGGRNITPTYQISLDILSGLAKPELQKNPRPRKGDIMSSFAALGYYTDPGGISVGTKVSDGIKGDIIDRKDDTGNHKGDILDVKGDAMVSPEPSVRTVNETSVRNQHHQITGHGSSGSNSFSDSDSLRSSGGVAAEQMEIRHRGKLETLKRRYEQFATNPQMRKFVIDAEIGNDERLRVKFEEWLNSEGNQDKVRTARA